MKKEIIEIIRKFHITNEIKTYDQCAEEILRVFNTTKNKELFGLIESIHHLFESDKPITKDSHIGRSIELAYKTFKD